MRDHRGQDKDSHMGISSSLPERRRACTYTGSVCRQQRRKDCGLSVLKFYIKKIHFLNYLTISYFMLTMLMFTNIKSSRLLGSFSGVIGLKGFELLYQKAK